MASSLVKSSKNMKRTEAKKSNSCWWDSHISSRNSRWLAENLEDMEQNIKRMLKLIEEDGDSLAKKAEMYYQKRPELIAQVEDFQRLYRSLAERYDHVTGELRRNIPSDLQSQGSGISDAGSESALTWTPDQRPSRRNSGPRAAGFEFFLGSGGSSSDLCNKEGDESSTLDSESESDDSASVNSYSIGPANGEERRLRRKVNELEVELRDVKEKLRKQEENTDSYSKGIRNGNTNAEDLLARIAMYEEEMRDAREKIRLSEEEITRLKIELQNNRSVDVTNNSETGKKQVNEVEEIIDRSQGEGLDSECKNLTIEEDLRITKAKLQSSEKETGNLRCELEKSSSTIKKLQDQLGSTQKDVATWKAKHDKEQREVSKLQDRITRYKANLSGRDQEIRGLREAISNANQSLSEENMQLQAEITKLSKEKTYLEDNIKEWDHRCQSLEDEVRRVKLAKTEMESMLRDETEQLKAAFKLEYDNLIIERDELSTRISMLVSDMKSKDDRIEHLDKHLKQVLTDHEELISKTEDTRKLVQELQSKVRELEDEVGKQKQVILERAEEKREVIRQLCFSLEHYRNDYNRLREAVLGHKRHPVMAS